jgi:hypothetical protein
MKYLWVSIAGKYRLKIDRLDDAIRLFQLETLINAR